MSEHKTLDDAGKKLARSIFESCEARERIHLTEEELAAMLTLAMQTTYAACKSAAEAAVER